MGILKSFEHHMVDMEIYRSNQLIIKTKGLLNETKQTHEKYINFYPGTDVKVGDEIHLSSFDTTYYVTRIEPTFFNGKIETIDAYYSLNPAPSSDTASSITYNINNPVNTIVGSQSTATINVDNFPMEKFNDMIEKMGNEDKAELRELSETVRKIIENQENPKKGILSKFSDLLAKHSWALQIISQSFIAWLTNN